MTLGNLFGRAGLGLAAAAVLGAVGLTAVPQPAQALGPGAAVGIGLGAFALGTALGAAANPYYGPATTATPMAITRRRRPIIRAIMRPGAAGIRITGATTPADADAPGQRGAGIRPLPIDLIDTSSAG